MTVDEWAGRVDALLREIEPSLEPHGENGSWTLGGRSVHPRVAEDDSSLRVFFAPRDEADPAASDPGFTHERMYMRGEAEASRAAADIAAFLTFGEIPRPS